MLAVPNSCPMRSALSLPLPESQTEIHLNCKPTTIRDRRKQFSMCHVPCDRPCDLLAKALLDYRFRYLSYRLRLWPELDCSVLSCK